MSIDRKRVEQILKSSPTKALVDGKFVATNGKQSILRKSPVDGRDLPEIKSSDASAVEAAVSSGEKAFKEKRWNGKTLDERKEILFRLAELLMEHRETLAVLDSMSMGKPVTDCIERDVPNAAKCIRWFAEAMDKIYDQCAPPHPDSLATITREPIGVVGAITPWNYPVENVAWKIGPSLAAGNSIVLKPSENSTLSALFIGQLALEAGIPDGVLNIIPGVGEETGRALALNKNIGGVFFTGSTFTGRKMLQYSAESNMKRVALECGGKSAFVVLKSCRHLSEAATALAASMFRNQGQTCSAPSRLIVDKDVAEEMLALVKKQMAKFVPADPLNSETEVGALVSQQHLEKVLSYVKSGVESGAKLVSGGEQVHPVKGGAFMSPAVLTGVKSQMKLAQEEIFGPVLAVQSVSNDAEAVMMANDNMYGLAAAVWSDDIDTALKVSRQFQAGTVHINCYGEDDITAPFGGFKQSGNGSKEKSLLALDAHTQKKTTWIKLR